MDQFYSVFKSYATHFAEIPLFPLLQCVHFTIVNLKLRMEEGKSSVDKNLYCELNLKAI